MQDHISLTTADKLFLSRALDIQLEKHLAHFKDDQKVARVRVSRHPRWGYVVNFDMILPGRTHLYARDHNRSLRNAVTTVRDEVKSQIIAFTGKLAKKAFRNLRVRKNHQDDYIFQDDY